MYEHARTQPHLWVIDLNPGGHGARLRINRRLQKVDRALERPVHIRRCDLHGLSVADQRYVGFKNIGLNPYGAEIGDGVENVSLFDVLSLTDVTFGDDTGN